MTEGRLVPSRLDLTTIGFAGGSAGSGAHDSKVRTGGGVMTDSVLLAECAVRFVDAIWGKLAGGIKEEHIMRIDFFVAGTVASLLAPLSGPVWFFGGAEIACAQQAKTVDAKSAAPKPAADLHAGTSTYKGWVVDEEGKKTDFVATRTIKEQGDAWIVTETAKQAEGEATDETVLAKGSLVLRQRSIVQRPFKMDYVVKDGRAIGKMQVGGQLRPILVDLGGELFADGAGRSAVVAALPLAAGYETSFNNFELPSLSITAKRLKVVGSERVTVPAGKFNTFKVQVTSDEGDETTFWVAKSPRKTVKMVTKSPELSGGVITTELQK
jgi:hypothetical protein